MGKESFKILHLYHDLMNLYGNWANVVVLQRELVARGYEASIEKKSVGDVIDFDAYDFVLIGSGTERSQLACMRDLAQYKDAFISRIEAGIPVLVTGNSHELFGKTVTDALGNRHEMLGLLDFETVQLSKRVTGDCVCKATFLQEKLIGFINRAGGDQVGDIERPFYIEPGEGANYKATKEGIMYKNLLGTYMTGPILVRNPPVLKYFADILIREEKPKEANQKTQSQDLADDPFFVYQEKAYNLALDSL
jgi:CobQ-like glutamine amidotransferase family enzyme